MKNCLLVLLLAACGPTYGHVEMPHDVPHAWVEPTEFAISAWNKVHPALSPSCEETVRAVWFDIVERAELEQHCLPVPGYIIRGCTFDDGRGLHVQIGSDSADDWTVYAHELFHVAHICGAPPFSLDAHHEDAVLWALDPSDSLHR